MKPTKRASFPGRDLIEYLLARLFAGLMNSLPIEASTAFASTLGILSFKILRKRRQTTLQNLEKAFPGPENAALRLKLAKESFRSTAISLMEFFRIPVMLKEAKNRFEFEGTEILDQVFARGKGLVFAISHFGSWEYLAFLPFLRAYPCSVIVRDIRNPYIFKWIQRLREQTQLHPIPKVNSAKTILKRLKENQLVAILIDQWAGKDGLWEKFFGHPTSTTPIPAKLAARTGAAIVPGYCIRVAPGRYKIIIRPELLVDTSEENFEQKTTVRLNQLLEEEILKRPGQWMWGHQRWKPVERYRKIISSAAVN